MTQSPPLLSPEVLARIDAHLDAVDRQLIDARVNHGRRRQITGDLQAQIVDMLHERAGADPGLADLEAILAELDPPTAYAQAASIDTAALRQAAGGLPSAGPSSRLSRSALFGACWAPLVGLAILVPFFYRSTLHTGITREVVQLDDRHKMLLDRPVESGATLWKDGLMILLMAVGATAPVVTTILGIVAVSQIRHSGGRLFGLSLAVVDALVFPLLATDLAVVVLGNLVSREIEVGQWGQGRPPAPYWLIPAVALLMLVIIAAADYVLARSAWNAAIRPLRPATEPQGPAVPHRQV